MTASDLEPPSAGSALTVPPSRAPLVARAFRTLLSGNPDGTPPWVARIATGDPDCLVAPDGPSWVVHGSLTTLVGGVRALMMQALQPAAVTGVAEHSAYRTDTIGRLRRTTQGLVITTFADVATAESMAAAVRSMHERVTGTDPDGRPYMASDPNLLRWVHDAFTDSFLTAHLALGGREIPGGPDAYVGEWAASQSCWARSTSLRRRPSSTSSSTAIARSRASAVRLQLRMSPRSCARPTCLSPTAVLTACSRSRPRPLSPPEMPRSWVCRSVRARSGLPVACSTSSRGLCRRPLPLSAPLACASASELSRRRAMWCRWWASGGAVHRHDLRRHE